MTDIAIVGTGPYGLSIAAHLRRLGVPYRIFGRTMDSWISHMPKGMMLKSDGFASNIYDPEQNATLQQYCSENGINYSDRGTPVRLDTFCNYGLWFRDRMVPGLEEKLVRSIQPDPKGFLVGLDTGEKLSVKYVILAVGITHFGYIPENLRHLPAEFLTHSFQQADPALFRGRSVAVVGGGSSAIDLAGLLHEAGADVQLIAREDALKFHEKTTVDKPRSLWEQLRSPISGLGPGLKSRLFANAPELFHRLPERYRIDTVKTFLGPSGAYFSKEMVIGKVPLVLGYAIKAASVVGNQVSLELRTKEGEERELRVEHVIAGTGYRVDLNRLSFLSQSFRDQVRIAEGSPVLSSNFESSVPNLYFTGLAAAYSFGPVMRFAFGAGHTAKQLAHHLSREVARGRSWSAVPESEVTTVKGD